MVARLEETAQWKEYAKLSPKHREERIELVSQALVETYVQLDKDLLLLEESGLMVSAACKHSVFMSCCACQSRGYMTCGCFHAVFGRTSLAAPASRL
jgi:hypothetical protein